MHEFRDEIILVVKFLLLFTHFCPDEISSWDEAKKKRRVNTSSGDKTLQ